MKLVVTMCERSKVHLDEGRRKLETSHITQHIEEYHHGEVLNVKDNFKFDTIATHRAAYSRQISEALLIKNSKEIV